MKNLILVSGIILFLVILQGCFWTQATTCSVETAVSNGVASALSSPALLNCDSNGYATIQKSVQGLLDQRGVCSAVKEVIGQPICEAVEAVAMSLLISKIPDGCHPTVALSALQGVASSACKLIPF